MTLSSNLIKLDENKKYIIAIFKNNNLTTLYINYEFVEFININKCYKFVNINKSNRFRHTHFNEHLCPINNYENKTDIFELIYDFNYNHFIDILLTHYDKKNINNIYLDLQRYQIHKIILY